MPSIGQRGLSGIADDLSRKLRRRHPAANRLCIDIGSRHIKLVEAERRGEDVWIANALRFDTPAGAVTTNQVSDVAAVAGAIEQALATAHVSATRAVTCIPGPSAMIKRFRLPIEAADRLNAVVRAETENLTACAADTLRVDHQVSEIHLEEAIEVLVVAARRETVDTYVAAIEGARLRVEAVDVDYLALENMFAANYGMEASRTVALIHVGARFCAMSIQSHGSWRFSGNVSAGVDSIATAGDLVAEVDRALRFYWPESAGDRIDEVLLSGGGAELPGFHAQLAARIGCAVRNAEPFGRIKLGLASEHDEIRRAATSFAVAAGLAMRSLEEP